MAEPYSRRHESDQLRLDGRWSWSGAPEIADDTMKVPPRMHWSDEHDTVPVGDIIARLRTPTPLTSRMSLAKFLTGSEYRVSRPFHLVADLQAPEAVEAWSGKGHVAYLRGTRQAPRVCGPRISRRDHIERIQ